MTTGAEAVADALVRHGVETIFCLPGEETIALLDALTSAGIEPVVVRHEQHGAFMAAAHGRLTGRPGVLVTTLGPGMTNALTGLAHATLGGFPVVHIAGQKPLRDNWEGSFQVIDQLAAAAAVTKHAVGITDAGTAAATVHDAMRRALHERPGAVFVELPKDVASDPAGDLVEWAPPAPNPPRVSDALIDDLAERLSASVFPIALVGAGAQTSSIPVALDEFANATGIPVVPLQMGIGAIRADHPTAMPPVPMHSPDAAHLALEHADLVLTVGYHPDEHPPLAWSRDGHTIVHLAAWPAPIRQGYRPESELVGDTADTLRRAASATPPRDRVRADAVRDAVRQQLESERLTTADDPMSPIEIVHTLRDVLPQDARVALDNGSYKLWFARHFDTFEPNGLLLDNALATMGAGLATATEAARLDPHRRVVAVIGDGGFLMNVGDLETAVRLGLDHLTVVVLRDDTYGFIADHQRERGARRTAVDITNPDLVTLAEAFGATGLRAETPDELRARLEIAAQQDGVTVIDCPFDELADERLHDIDSLAEARTRLG